MTAVEVAPVTDQAVERVEPFANSLDHLLAGLTYIDLRVRWAVVRARSSGLNPDDEFRGLYISDEQVDALLGYELGQTLWPKGNGQMAGLEEWPAALQKLQAGWQARAVVSRQQGRDLLLDRLAQDFDLSPVELDALLIALAPELDPRYERLFAYLQDDVTRKRPTVDLILNLLSDHFQEKLHLRRLFADDSRLLASRLIYCFSDSAGRDPSLLSHFVRPAARVAAHLLGHSGVDEQIAGSAELLDRERAAPPADSALPAELIAQLTATAGQQPLYSFIGGYGLGKGEAARHIAQANNQPLLTVHLADWAKEDELLEKLRLVWRDGRLANAVLYITGWQTILDEDDRPPYAIFKLLLDYPHTVILAGSAPWQPAERTTVRPILRVHFDAPDYRRRLRIWRQELADAGANLSLEGLANQFHFSPGQIADTVATAQDYARWRGETVSEDDLFAASRAHSNQRLSSLATKIRPRYRWEDIVLPQDTRQQLREMVSTVRQRPTVYGRWGFERKLALGKGLNALFAGESGTGKTMAADIMANELGLDLYKIDLSSMVSKYIGETEKNLNRIFTEAATSNAILFFDEADAIFGKRSEVKDSHDRYANIEISYLLQRMEAYDGVVILATNMRSNLDEAFTRRLHFIVEFPFPEAADRERIWRVNVPPETPLSAGIDFGALAERFRLAGGNIRNIIMAAAFLAAEEDEVVEMSHLLHAARREYQKMGRLIDENLFMWR